MNLTYFGRRKVEVLNSLILKIMAKENDTNDILQTFRCDDNSCYHHQCIANWTAV